MWPRPLESVFALVLYIHSCRLFPRGPFSSASSGSLSYLTTVQSVFHSLEVFSIFLVGWGKSLYYNSPFQLYKMPSTKPLITQDACLLHMLLKNVERRLFCRMPEVSCSFHFRLLVSRDVTLLGGQRHLQCTISQFTVPV